ncbi:MAG: hypothetical protein O3A00_20105, partial [Planctomycetota bacterium]|nr:hypothetical protein [Planctomycetota bacterium]
MFITNWLNSTIQRIRDQRRTRRRQQRANRPAAALRTEVLEDRSLLSAFSASGATLDINLTAGESLQIVSAGTSYTLTSSGTWSGTTSSSVSTSGSTLTVTSAGLTAFSTINVTDSGSGAAVTFNNSGANAYGDSFNVTLDNATPGAVTFNGTSQFTGSAGLSVVTAGNILLNSSPITTSGGDVSLIASNGVTLSGAAADVTTGGGMFTVDADSDDNGSGTFT